MNRIILLRHGRTQANDQWLYCGSTDLPLSDSGRVQLEKLRESCAWPDIGAFRVYTSGMRRTEETLEVIFGDVAHCAEPGFREMDFGRFEMHSYEELCTDEEYRAWCDGDNEANVTPGGESGRQMTARVIEAFEKVKERGEDALIVCHGGPIAAVMAHLFPDTGKNRFQWQPKNGTGYMITFDGDRISWETIPTGGISDG